MEELILNALKAKPTTKKFDLGGCSVVLRTLVNSEREEISKRILALNPMAEEHLVKAPVLGYAIVSVNGINLRSSPELQKAQEKSKDKPFNRVVEDTIVANMPVTLIDILYNYHKELCEEEAQNYLKIKNSSADHSEEASGNSTTK